jgi:uncharacterized membrane protein
MSGMYELWLFLHVLGAIVAFGFGFYAPVFGAMTAREPQYGNWYLRVGKRISNIFIIPFGLSMFVTGVLLVSEVGGFRRFEELWLALSLVIYVAAMFVVLVPTRRAVDRLIPMTVTPPGPEGPPAEVAQLLRRMQLYGLFLLAAVVVIVALMVFKPQL